MSVVVVSVVVGLVSLPVLVLGGSVVAVLVVVAMPAVVVVSGVAAAVAGVVVVVVSVVAVGALVVVALRVLVGFAAVVVGARSLLGMFVVVLLSGVVASGSSPSADPQANATKHTMQASVAPPRRPNALNQRVLMRAPSHANEERSERFADARVSKGWVTVPSLANEDRSQQRHLDSIGCVRGLGECLI